VLRPAVRRPGHRRRDRIRDLLAADTGACARPPSGREGKAGRRRLPQAVGAVVVAERRLPRNAGHLAQRPGNAGADRAVGDHPGPGAGGPALAVVAGAMSVHGGQVQWWLATLGRNIVWARL